MVSQGALLKTSGIVYSVHHPAGLHDAATWDAGFGYLVTYRAAPVVNGEWTNYEPAPDRVPRRRTVTAGRTRRPRSRRT